MLRFARPPVLGPLVPLVLVLAGALVVTAAHAQPPPSEEDLVKSRDLYQEAEVAAKAGDWQVAADKYEQAYYLVPSKHGFAYKVGTAAWAAGDCERAEKYLSHFRTYGSPDKHPEYMTEADRILNQIEFKGCAEPPPADPAESEASKRGCAVEEGSPAALGLFVLLVLARRRREA